MKLSKAKQTEFEETMKEVAAIAATSVTGVQLSDSLLVTIRGLNGVFDIALYTKHQLSVISYVGERLPACLPKILDLYPSHYDHTTMLIYAESLDRGDLETLSLNALSRLKVYSENYHASLYLYTVGGGTHDRYNLDVRSLIKHESANILDIPVLDNQPLTVVNYVSVITDMRDIVYRRYYKYIEDNLGTH